jgi:hypothetical protein
MIALAEASEGKARAAQAAEARLRQQARAAEDGDGSENRYWESKKWLAKPSGARIVAEVTEGTQFDAMNTKSNGKSRLTTKTASKLL